MHGRTLACLLVALIVFPTMASGQSANRTPREFPEFRGTWIREEAAGKGNIQGLPLARTLVITTTPTEIALVKNAGAPEVYRFDGTETELGDGRRGRFSLVADSIALTTRRVRPSREEYFLTNVITDAYSVAGDVLTLERHLSVVVEPEGSLATLQNPNNNRQTIVYRRAPPDAR